MERKIRYLLSGIITLCLLLAFAGLWISLTGFTGGYQEGDASSCLKAVKDLYRKVSALPALPENNKRVYLMDYTIRTAMHDSVNKPLSVARITAYMGKDRAHIFTERARVYHEPEYSLAVLPDRKIVVLSDALPAGEQRKAALMKNMVQDTLLDDCTVKECKTLTPAGDRHIVLEPKKGIEKKYSFSRIAFVTDAKQEKILGMRTDYWDPEGIAYIDMTFHKIDYAYKTGELKPSAARLIFSSGLTLRPEYKGYRLVDNRVKKGKLD